MIEYVKTLRKNLQDTDAPEKTYAVAQSRGTLSLEEVADHISSHNSKYDEGDVYAVIVQALKCMRELLLDGYVIAMGKLGSFQVVLKSTGVCESVVDEETGKKPVFTAADIKDIRVRWTPGQPFKDLINDATFRETITRKKKAEQIKIQNAANANGDGSKEDDMEVHE